MFALVAFRCLWLGTSNIGKAFRVPFSQWENINWALMITGVLLLAVAVRCIWQANKDYKEAKILKEKQQRQEEEKRRRQFFFDDEEKQ